MSKYSSDDESHKEKLKGNKPSENEVDKLISSTYDEGNDIVEAANKMQEQLGKVHLDPHQQQYAANSITPLITLLVELSTTSFNLATSVGVLSSNPIVSRKKSKLKDTIRLIYNLNDECEDIFKVVKKRIEYLIDDTKEDKE